MGIDEDDLEDIDIFHTELKSARLKNDIKAALEKLKDIRGILEKYPREEALQEWSRYHYEDAFLLNIAGHVKEAAHAFAQSGQCARENGDELRGLIGDFRNHLTLYLGDEQSAQATLAAFRDIQKGYDSLQKVPAEDAGLLKGSLLNIAKRLHELAFETLASDCTLLTQNFQDHEDMRNARTDPDASHELLFAQSNARTAILDGHMDAAEAIFAAYLDVTIPQLEADPNVRIREDIKHFTHNGAEEISRDYRDFGRTLLASSRANGKEEAIQVWKRGLQVHSGRGNLRFLNDIESDLEAVGAN